MLKHLYSFLCTGTSLDSQDGTLSAFNIIDNFNIPNIPNQEMPIEEQLKSGVLVPMAVHCVTGWSGQVSGDIEFIKTIYNNDNEKIAEISTPLSVNSEQNRFNIREVLNGIPLKGVGNYRFIMQIKQDNKTIAKSEYPFIVKLQNV